MAFKLFGIPYIILGDDWDNIVANKGHECE